MRGCREPSTSGAKRRPVVQPVPAALPLSALVAVLAAAASAAGLWWGVRGVPAPFATVRGEMVNLVGGGLYRHDTVFAGAGQRGSDAVVLFVAVPLLVAAAARYRRGSSRAGLALLGVHGFLLYVYGSAALGTVAYNRLFPVYVGIFSATLFAVAALASAVDADALHARIVGALPYAALGLFLIVSGAVTFVIWGLPTAAAVVSGVATERLDSYATDVTYALDLAVVAPLAVLAGVLVRRRSVRGVVLAVPLLTLETMLVLLIGAQTASQLAAGVSLTPPQVVGPVGGFVALSVLAGWFLAGLLRLVGSPTAAEPPAAELRGVRPG